MLLLLPLISPLPKSTALECGSDSELPSRREADVSGSTHRDTATLAQGVMHRSIQRRLKRKQSEATDDIAFKLLDVVCVEGAGKPATCTIRVQPSSTAQAVFVLLCQQRGASSVRLSCASPEGAAFASRDRALTAPRLAV